MNSERKIIIYGAGARGQGIYHFFCERGMGQHIAGFCDKNYMELRNHTEIQMYGFDEIKEKNYCFLISMTDKKVAAEVKKMFDANKCAYCTLDELAEMFGEDRVAFNREFCAFFHIRGMDKYFESAEGKAGMDIFWKEDSAFYKYFRKLNIDRVVELACGKGRHVPKYIDGAQEVVLVDILPENISFCRERFKDYQNITYYCNDGKDLQELKTESYTAVFSYDAMVHFELMDIYEYLKDFYRILEHGGCALVHHSNNYKDYRASFANAPEGRSFMSKEVFAYLAYRVGFEIVEQQIIDWGVKDLDCITLLRKR